MKNCYHKINKNKIANIYYDWCIDTITDSLSGVTTLLLIFLSREYLDFLLFSNHITTHLRDNNITY